MMGETYGFMEAKEGIWITSRNDKPREIRSQVEKEYVE